MIPAVGDDPVDVGSWVERWLSPPRWARYLDAVDGDRGRALVLYEWNARASAAVLHDLAHLEIGLRNAYDRVLAAATPGGDWTDPAGPLFAPIWRTRRHQRVDVNQRCRQALAEARRVAGAGVPRGKVVAELTFGFWRYLSSAAHEKSLWVPHLHRAFARRTRRHDDVDRPVADLNRLRNRAAHHEHLLTVDLRQAHRTGVALADRIDPDLGAHLRRTAALPSIVADSRTPPGVRPTPRGARWAGIDASDCSST